MGVPSGEMVQCVVRLGLAPGVGQRTQASNELFVAGFGYQRYGHPCDRFGLLSTVKNKRGNVTGYNRCYRQDGALTNGKSFSGRCSDHTVCSNESPLTENYLTRPSSMRDDGCPQADLHPAMDFDTFRVFILKVDIVANENLPVDLHTPKAMKKRAERGRPG